MSDFEDRIFEEAIKETTLSDPKKEEMSFKPVLIGQIPDDKKDYDWIWEGVIAKHHATLLTSLFKTGKSTFLRCLIRAIFDEEEFLGMPTKKCNILVVSEESFHEWKNKAPDFRLDEDDLPLWISKPPFYGKTGKKNWEKFIMEDLYNFAMANKIDLIVIDTVSHFWPVDRENDASETGSALSPFDKLRDNGIALLLVQQSNKAGGDFAKSIRGSTEIGGWPDEIIVFGRTEGDNTKTRRRQISFFGRLYDSEEQLIISLQPDNTYKAEGSKYEVSKAARFEVVMSIITNTNYPLTLRQIRDGWDDTFYGSKPSDDTMRRYVHELIERAKLRFVNYVTVGKSKTPTFGLAEKLYLEQQTADLTPPSIGSAMRSVNDGNNDLNNVTQRSAMGIGKVAVSSKMKEPDEAW